MKNMTQLKCLVNGKEHIFFCDMESSTTEVKESLYQFMKYVGQVEDAHTSKLKEEQDSKVEEPALIEEGLYGNI